MKAQAIEPLSTPDKRRLASLEQVIDDGMKSFVAVGNALLTIKTDSLYRGLDLSFEGYCKKRFGFAKSRAYQLMDSAKVVTAVSTIVENVGDLNEAQARVLSSLPSESAQATVLAKAIETAPKDADNKPKLTAAHIKKTAEQSGLATGPKKPAKADDPKAAKEAVKAAVASQSEDDSGGFEPNEAKPHIVKLSAALGKAARHWADVKQVLGASPSLTAIFTGIDAATKALAQFQQQQKRKGKK